MSGVSDRDQKIIFVLLTAMVILLPYFFFIKDKRVETAGVRTEIVALNERLEYLRGLDAERDRYIKETKKMNDDRDAIIASFPADIRPENFTMYLLDCELSTLRPADDGTGLNIADPKFNFNAVTYGINVETPISSEDADTGLNALTNTSSIEYISYYKGMKYILQYMMEYEDPMAYRGFSAKFDQESGEIKGMIVLDQYAVEGDNRKLEAADIHPDLDLLNLRGNAKYGIFGQSDREWKDEFLNGGEEENGQGEGEESTETTDDQQI